MSQATTTKPDIARVTVTPIRWVVYKEIKRKVVETMTDRLQTILSENPDADIEQQLFLNADQLVGIIDEVQDEFILGCCDITPEELNLCNVDDIGILYEKALEQTPLQKLLDLEKNSPVGQAMKQLGLIDKFTAAKSQVSSAETSETSTTPDSANEETPEASEVYEPDGGSNLNHSSSESPEPTPAISKD
jgi:hypothetical protein